MWANNSAYEVTDGPMTQSDQISATAWDRDYAALLDMEGLERHYKERITLHRNNDYADAVFLDWHAMSISANYTVNDSSDSGYTVDTGFLSLNGAHEILQWAAIDGSVTGGNLTLFQAYRLGASPSLSYGLHVGSVEPNVTGSLVLGGYDKSRCLNDPVVSSYDTVQLHGLALNVSKGGHAYLNATSAYIPNLFRANGTAIDSVSVHPRPGAPHLYLPQDTCDVIASHLPVTYDPDFNLYFWNTNEQAYMDIISSPHYLIFTFASEDGKESTINVPFALFNLTLTSPIVSSPTQYFPCKPWIPGMIGYTLGSSFLQAAFLAQNWHENELFLAQAPGPDFLSPSVQKIAYTDRALTPARTPPSWEASWSSTLRALPDGSRASDASSSDRTSAIPGSTIAGITVGAIAGLALLGAAVWFVIRRWEQRIVKKTAQQAPGNKFPQHNPQDHSAQQLGKAVFTTCEAEAR